MYSRRPYSGAPYSSFREPNITGYIPPPELWLSGVLRAWQPPDPQPVQQAKYVVQSFALSTVGQVPVMMRVIPWANPSWW